MFPPEFWGVDVIGVSIPCDYPTPANVRLGVVYSSGLLIGTLVVPTVPDPAAQVSVLINVYDEDGQLEDGVKVYKQMVVPPPNPGVYSDKIKEAISANGIVVFNNLFTGAAYHFWCGRSDRIYRKILDEGEPGITPPTNFEAMIVELNVALTWEAAFLTLFFGPPIILGNNSVDPCIT